MTGWHPFRRGNEDEEAQEEPKDRRPMDEEKAGENRPPPDDTPGGHPSEGGVEHPCGEHGETKEPMVPDAVPSDRRTEIQGDGPEQDQREQDTLRFLKGEDRTMREGPSEEAQVIFIRQVFSDIQCALNDIQVFIASDENLSKSKTIGAITKRITWDVEDLEMWVTKSKPLPSGEVRMEIMKRKLGNKEKKKP